MQPQNQPNNQPPHAETQDENIPPNVPKPNLQPSPVPQQESGKFDPTKIYSSGPNSRDFRTATNKNNTRALLLILSSIPLFVIGWYFTILATSFGGAFAYKGGLEAKAFGNKKLFVFGMVMGTLNLLFVLYYFISRVAG
jgi:hypothetical protein